MAQKISFASIGDICVDTYKIQNKFFAGGTAFNSAFFAHQLGAKTSILSAVGKDASGSRFIRIANTLGIDTHHVMVGQGPTSTVDVLTTATKTPEYQQWNLGVLSDYRLSEEDKEFLTTQDIIKTVLFAPMEGLFEHVTALTLPHALKVADFSDISHYTKNMHALFAYASGFDIIVKSLDPNDTASLSLLRDISLKQHKLTLALLGEKGSMVFYNGNRYKEPSMKTTVVDTNGAGDAYIAYFSIIYLKTKDIRTAMVEATKAASGVVKTLGATGIEING